MQRLFIYALVLIPAGCNTVHSQAPPLGTQAGQARFATFAPVPARLSNPAVATDRSLLDYADDLDRCKAGAAARMGGEEADDLAALRRALRRGPLGDTVSVSYETADNAVSRDKLVKDCLSKRGYLVDR